MSRAATPSQWEVVIGLETHAQLATHSKIFSGSSITFGAAPNTQASPVDLALPGVLPVLNKGAVECAVKFGLAVGATIAERSIFARKNYFYPDLPKGYQISQFEIPVVQGGGLTILVDGVEKHVRLTRAHLEEDAGKSLHEDFAGMSGIDLNRAGTPLLEIVTEPEMRSAAEAVAYAKTLHALVTRLGICDGNMQEGSFRCDANVSVRPVGQKEFGTRCEIKNLNSFRFMERAIEYEVRRQIELIEDGGTVVQETRLFDPNKNETRSMRSKEDAMDYRYFPDPDLLPLAIPAEMIERIRATMPELPAQLKYRFVAASVVEYQGILRKQLDIDDDADLDAALSPTLRSTLRKMLERENSGAFSLVYGLSEQDAQTLTLIRGLPEYFEALVAATNGQVKLSANWILGEFLSYLNESGLDVDSAHVKPSQFGQLLNRIADGTISGKIAKDVFAAMWNEGNANEGSADAIIEARGLRQISDAGALEKIVGDILAANPKSVEEFRAGKEKAFNALVGQAMKASKGKANPAQINEILRRKLTSKI